MNVFLTGGTGFVGSAILKQLLAHGHQVTALVRSDSSAQKVTAAGATAVLGDITDVAWLAAQLARSDAAIHAASPGDAASPSVDSSAARGAVNAFAGTDKTYIHTGGIWVYGPGAALTEETRLDPPALTAWRPDVERILRDARSVRAVIIVPAVVYGNAMGIPRVIIDAPRDPSGALHLVGDGSQHWTTVQVDDLADLYVRAVESRSAHGHYFATGDQSPTVRELTEAASRVAGADGAVHPETPEETRNRLGELFADALLIDQQSASTKARDELGWAPNATSLLDEIAAGNYK